MLDSGMPRVLRWFPKVDETWGNMVVLVPSLHNPEVGSLGCVVAIDGLLSRVLTDDGRDAWFDIDDIRDPGQA